MITMNISEIASSSFKGNGFFTARLLAHYGKLEKKNLHNGSSTILTLVSQYLPGVITVPCINYEKMLGSPGFAGHFFHN